MKSLALILFTSILPLLASAQASLYPDFNQYFDDFYFIEKTQDSARGKLLLHQRQDHLSFSYEDLRPKLRYSDSTPHADFYNIYVYELQALLRYTHFNLDSVLNQLPECNIDMAKETLIQRLVMSGYADAYYSYAYDYYNAENLKKYGPDERPIEVHLDSLCKVYSYCFSVLSLHPQVLFHWCSYKGPITGPQQNFLIVYCEKMRSQQALGDLQQQMTQEMFRLAEELEQNDSGELTKERIEKEFRILFNHNPSVKEAVIAFYNNDRNKVIKLLY